VSKRSPILGYNHNIGHRGLVFHVQTEDSGVDNPHIFTHLFHGGSIIFTRKIDYDAAADESLVKSLMQAQHKAMLKELKRGVFDERIDSFLGDHPDLTPRKARDTIPDSPAGSRLLSEPSDEYAEVSITTAAEEDASATAEMAVIASDDWISTPSEITSSEVSDVFRVIMQPALDANDDGDPGRGHRLPEIRIESLKPGAANNRRIQRDTVEIHSTPPSDEPPELELHSAIPAPRARPTPPPPPSPRSVPRAPTPSSHVSARAEGSVLVSRPPIRVDSHSSHSAQSAQSAGKRTAPPPPPRASRPMAPRTVREDPLDSLFDQQAISEKSLDEVILAYLSDDAGKDEP
jgi:hypothetical protein